MNYCEHILWNIFYDVILDLTGFWNIINSPCFFLYLSNLLTIVWFGDSIAMILYHDRSYNIVIILP